MRGNGNPVRKKGLGSIFSIVVLSMKATGRETKNMGKDPSILGMGINTKVTGGMINSMVKVIYS